MPADHPDLARRAALASAAAAVTAVAAAACTGGKKRNAQRTGAPAPRRTTSAAGGATEPADVSARTLPAPDAAGIRAAALREVNLIKAYDAVAAQVPAALVLLAEFRSHHEAHLARLRDMSGVPDVPSAPAAPQPLPASPSGSTSVSAAPPTKRAVQALIAALARKENEAAGAGAKASATAGPTDFAIVLAEIAGSEAQHGVLLPRLPIAAAS